MHPRRPQRSSHPDFHLSLQYRHNHDVCNRHASDQQRHRPETDQQTCQRLLRCLARRKRVRRSGDLHGVGLLWGDRCRNHLDHIVDGPQHDPYVQRGGLRFAIEKHLRSGVSDEAGPVKVGVNRHALQNANHAKPLVSNENPHRRVDRTDPKAFGRNRAECNHWDLLQSFLEETACCDLTADHIEQARCCGYDGEPTSVEFGNEVVAAQRGIDGGDANHIIHRSDTGDHRDCIFRNLRSLPENPRTGSHPQKVRAKVVESRKQISAT